MKRLILLIVSLSLYFMAFAQGGEKKQGYWAYIDCTLGDAYNLNTAQTISTNNMQWYSLFSTTHGYHWKNLFVGVGVGYYHSFRDKENMYPLYSAFRYVFRNGKLKPFVETRVGIIYDPYWIEKIQKYGALGVGVNLYKGLQVGLRGSIFSRPSRFFTANASIVLSYEFGE